MAELVRDPPPIPAGILGGYRSLLGAAGVLLFFCNLALFLYFKGKTPVPPVYVAIAFAAATSPLAPLRGTVVILLRSPLLLWIGGYGVLVSASFFWSSGSHVAAEELEHRLPWLIALGAHLVLLTDHQVVTGVRRAALAAVLWGTAVNLWDLFHPGTLGVIFGRSAGWYLNPNISGTALTSGMVLAIPVVTRAWRPWVVLASGVGVLVTLSRGAALCFLVVIGVLLWLRELDAGRLLRGLLLVGCLVAGLLTATGRLGALISLASTGSGQLRAWERVLSPGEAVRSGDPSTTLRRDVLLLSFHAIGEHPIIGNGVGHSAEWELPISTHNLYVRDMVEFGLGGVLVYPAFLAALMWGLGPEVRRRVLPIVTVLALTALVSHNMLDDWATILPTSVAAAEGAIHRVGSSSPREAHG